MKRLSTLILFVIYIATLKAQVELRPPVYGNKSLIAPLYFGPNAFPVPDMTDGSTVRELSIELAADGYFGYSSDKTADIFARLRIPLFTDRVNLTIWMPVVEFFQSTDQRLQTCRVLDEYKDDARSGHEAGDVFVSTDIMFLREKTKCPAMTIRAAVKTASGGGFHLARYYDNPGYFFDMSVGKSLFFLKGKYVNWNNRADAATELRLAASAGFLCWQTDNGRQNDAVMFGIMARLKTKYVSVEEVFSGYIGWENDGDQPITLKTKVAGHIKGFSPYVMYQYGVKDYPFHQVRLGLIYDLDILSRKQKLH